MGTTETNSKPLYIKEMRERFAQREIIRSRNIEVLSENNPQKILQLESEPRKEARRGLLQLEGEPRNDPTRGVIPSDEHATLEGMVAGNDSMPVNYLSRGQNIAKSVCRIEVKNEQVYNARVGNWFYCIPNFTYYK